MPTVFWDLIPTMALECATSCGTSYCHTWTAQQICIFANKHENIHANNWAWQLARLAIIDCLVVVLVRVSCQSKVQAGSQIMRIYLAVNAFYIFRPA